MLLLEKQIGVTFLAGNSAKCAKNLKICTLLTLAILLLKIYSKDTIINILHSLATDIIAATLFMLAKKKWKMTIIFNKTG